MDSFEDVLTHYGIKGMRWGVRRAEGPDGTVGSNPNTLAVNTKTGKILEKNKKFDASEDAVKALAYKQVARTSGTQALTNDQLKLLLTRVELETKYSKAFGSTEKKGGKKFVQELLREEGKKQARSVVSAAATVAVANALAKRAASAGAKPLVVGVASKLAL